MAAQLTGTKGRPFRRLFSCTARAINSFPVPLSPRSRTVRSVPATLPTALKMCCMAGLPPTMPPRSNRSSAFWRSWDTSRASACASRAFSTTRSTSSTSNGFPM